MVIWNVSTDSLGGYKEEELIELVRRYAHLANKVSRSLSLLEYILSNIILIMLIFCRRFARISSEELELWIKIIK